MIDAISKSTLCCIIFSIFPEEQTVSKLLSYMSRATKLEKIGFDFCLGYLCLYTIVCLSYSEEEDKATSARKEV